MNATEMLKQLCVAVRDAAKPIRSHFRGVIGIQTKSDGTPVTDVDMAVHGSLLRWAHKHSLGYIGEEGSAWNGTDRYILYVDPLDGTGAYLRGLSTVTTIATIMERYRSAWRPLLAVIYDPLNNHLWSAAEGKRTRQRFTQPGYPTYIGRCQVRSPSPPFRVTAVAWQQAPHHLEQIRNRLEAEPEMGHQTYGSTGLGAGLIASGLMDAILTGSGSAVEVAAMLLIVRGAGGVATDLDGSPFGGFALTKSDLGHDFVLPRGAILSADQALTERLVAIVKEES